MEWFWQWSPPARLKGGGELPREGKAGQRAGELAARYGMSDWRRICGPVELAESLYVLDLLDRYAHFPEGRHLDVGSKYGAYLPGLAAYRPGWDAIEADAHRRYWNLRTRRAVGEAIAGALPDCRFMASDVRQLQGQYAGITWLLPFLFADVQAAWGLPASYFSPEATLRHVLSLLQPGGQLLVWNQGEEEAAEQERLFRALPVEARALGPCPSDLSPFRNLRWGWSLQRP